MKMIQDVLESFLKKEKVLTKYKGFQVTEVYNNEVKDQFSLLRQTSAKNFSDGILWLEVKDPQVAFEVTLLKSQIIDRIYHITKENNIFNIKIYLEK